MEIKIGVGLDNIVFGMSQEEVKNLLGLPDKVSNTVCKKANIVRRQCLRGRQPSFLKIDTKDLCDIRKVVYNALPRIIVLSLILYRITRL